MEHIIRRLEAIHRALRTAPASFGGDARVTESVAGCLRQLHAIAQSAQFAQSAEDDPARQARFPLIDGPSRRLHGFLNELKPSASFAQESFGKMAEAA